MNYSFNGEQIKAQNEAFVLEPGDYIAHIAGVTFRRDIDSKFGGKTSCFDFEYMVSVDFGEVLLSDRIYISDYVDSRCQRLIRSFYGDKIPDVFDPYILLNEECYICIDNKPSEKGRQYSHIISWDFNIHEESGHHESAVEPIITVSKDSDLDIGFKGPVGGETIA